MMSSIVKKSLMSVTGLGLSAFLVVHFIGNLLMLLGPETFNGYADKLEHSPITIPAEIGLVALFVVHVWLAVLVTFENTAARTKPAAVSNTVGEATIASRTMVYTGLILFVFIISHVWMFKFGDKAQADGLYGLVVRRFLDPLSLLWYVFAMGALGLHLSHALISAFQTLGLLKPGWYKKGRGPVALAGWALAIGFALLPLWAFATHQNAYPPGKSGKPAAKPAEHH